MAWPKHYSTELHSADLPLTYNFCFGCVRSLDGSHCEPCILSGRLVNTTTI